MSSIICKMHRRNHRTVIVRSTLFLTINAARRLPVLWTMTVQRVVLIFALDARVDVILVRTPLVNKETEDAVVDVEVDRYIDEISAFKP